jgi:Deoxynucleoside kinases
LNDIKYIAVEGVIGAGKTSLARKLGERLDAKLILEKFEENPFLKRFYDDPKHYAFHTQTYFLLSRFKQLTAETKSDLFHNYIVSDYIFEKDKIFAYLNLNDDELDLYERIVASIEKSIITPDLIVYLQNSTERLLANIKFRDRDYERNIQEDYIKNLNDAYNYYFFRYKKSKLIIVNASEIDFVNNEKEFEDLFNEITKPVHAAIEYYDPVNKRLAR